MRIRFAIGVGALAVATACGGPATLAELHPDSTCRRAVVVGPLGSPVAAESVEPGAASEPAEARDSQAAPESGGAPEAEEALDPDAADPPLRWLLPEVTTDVHQLNAWCAAVGPAAVGGWAEPPPDGVVLDSLLVVSWNVHVGGGHLRELVADLRAGRLTGGQPIEHFVLLLQEAYRGTDDIPEFDPSLPGGGVIESEPVAGPREDILRDARELGLAVFYVPSMRNASAPGGPREDRGNAILSTIPLEDRIAIELPVARQRRVAVGGYVSGRNSSGAPWRLHLASVHLENNASGWISDEQARLIQTRALLDALPDAEPAIAAGDFNTWTRGPNEALVHEMARAFPDTPPFPPGPTYRKQFGIVRQYLDYMFVRLPDDARARYRRLPEAYNSDHFPLLGWIVMPPVATPRASPDGAGLEG